MQANTALSTQIAGEHQGLKVEICAADVGRVRSVHDNLLPVTLSTAAAQLHISSQHSLHKQVGTSGMSRQCKLQQQPADKGRFIIPACASCLCEFEACTMLCHVLIQAPHPCQKYEIVIASAEPQ